MSDIFKNPGANCNESFLHYRDYVFKRMPVQSTYTAEYMKLPEGAQVISVYFCKDMEWDDNTIVFYHIGEEKKICVELRRSFYFSSVILRDVEILKPEFIQHVTKHSVPLPDIFDSPYGRIYRIEAHPSKYKRVEAGFSRVCRDVFQFAKDGLYRTRSEGVFYIVEFDNGDVILARSGIKTGIGDTPIVPAVIDHITGILEDWGLNEGILQPHEPVTSYVKVDERRAFSLWGRLMSRLRGINSNQKE